MATMATTTMVSEIANITNADNYETHIMANMNDPRNMDVIIKENMDLKEFIPKIAPQKVVSIEVVENIEDTINNIFESKYLEMNFLEIIKNQNIMSTYLTNKYKAESENIVWNEFKIGLQWILVTSEFILSGKKIELKQFPTNKVCRSSYKFCQNKENCNNMYNNALQNTSKKSNHCNGDHYVHHKLIQDIRCLIAVLDNCQDSICNDLRVGLLTMSHVITHMYQELSVFQVYLRDSPNFNINNYYIVKNIKKGR